MSKIRKFMGFLVGKASRLAQSTNPPTLQPDPRQNEATFTHPTALGLTDQALAEAATYGGAPWGLILQRHQALLMPVVLEREANEVRQGDLADRLTTLDAELEALIFEPPAPLVPPAVPAPTVLHRVSHVLPFTNGDLRHG